MSLLPVVLDRRQNPEADTGTFELAYRQVIPKAPAYLGLSLCVNGKKLYKKSKERRHEPNKNATPSEPRAPSGDTNPDVDQPVPAEYSGPIITDFLSWLNPYDALPTNKDGILIGPKDSLTVRQALTVVKSGIALSSSAKKRKTSLSSRTHRGRRERNMSEFKRRVVPHSCCQPDEGKSANNAGKFRTESASKAEKKINRSVGNKRCYIDPVEWERETASILRPTISVQNKIINRTDTAHTMIPLRQTKSGIIGPQKSHLMSSQTGEVDPDSIKKLSAIGRNICKLRDENRNKQKAINFSKSCASIYAPYRVVVTPLNDESKSFTKRKNS